MIHYETALKNWVGGDTTSASDQFHRMLDAARQAVELDPGGWMGHSLASVGELWGTRPIDRPASTPTRRSTSTPAPAWRITCPAASMASAAILDEAIAIQTQSLSIDPDYRHADVIEADLGLWNFLVGDLDAARHHLQAALIAQPGNIRAHQRLAAVMAQAGDRASAHDELEVLRGIGAMPTSDYIAASYPFQNGDHADRFRTALCRAGVVMD